MEDIEISKLLRKNCSDEDMSKLLYNLFVFELTSGTRWTDKYNKEINEYYEKKVEK